MNPLLYIYTWANVEYPASPNLNIQYFDPANPTVLKRAHSLGQHAMFQHSPILILTFNALAINLFFHSFGDVTKQPCTTTTPSLLIRN